MMTSIAATVQAFFTDYLQRQRQVSPHTIACYRDSGRMLLAYAADRSATPCHRLEFAQLDAPMVAAFLDHLEKPRGISVRSRNVRLAAIHSLFRFAALRHPEHAEDIQRVLAIPTKLGDHTIVTYLTDDEVEAILTAPDLSTKTGRRDHALLHLAIETGLRASELTGLTCRDIHLDAGAHVHCRGKGRKDRITPLTTSAVKTLRAWTRERAANPQDPLFPTNRGGRMSPDSIAQRVNVHATNAAATCSSLNGKKSRPTSYGTPLPCDFSTRASTSPSSRSGSAMSTLPPHRSTSRPDLVLKQQALDRTTPLTSKTGRYQPPDTLIDFLETL
jgi:site-specific recombinase XerD